ncbi:MAG: hypothetical protein CME36_16060 [unclassified Hahellaceae]|nr:hypothetical protein [Hahellaceae bacterium]|tara:strand:- start:53136 stop:53627 length:492 start_codon:yes stop_codon:yes gene_type:complete
MNTSQSTPNLKPYMLHEVPRAIYLPVAGQGTSKTDRVERASFIKLLRRKVDGEKAAQTVSEQGVNIRLSVAAWLRIASQQEQRSALILVVRQEEGNTGIAIDKQLCRPNQSTMFSGEVELNTRRPPLSVHLALLGVRSGQAVYVDELFVQPVQMQANSTAQRA